MQRLVGLTARQVLVKANLLCRLRDRFGNTVKRLTQNIAQLPGHTKITLQHECQGSVAILAQGLLSDFGPGQ